MSKSVFKVFLPSKVAFDMPSIRDNGTNISGTNILEEEFESVLKVTTPAQASLKRGGENIP